MASAQVDGWIPEDRSNPARWKNWLDRKLAAPKKLGKIDRKTGERFGNAATTLQCPHAKVAAFMARLKDAPRRCGGRRLACHFLDGRGPTPPRRFAWRTFEEPGFSPPPCGRAPKIDMKMGEAHDVPLSDQALAIMRPPAGRTWRQRQPARLPR